MPNSEGTTDHEVENYQFEKGANWDVENVITILQWIHIAAINLDVMTEANTHYKRYIRRNTIISLILSTLASTASLSQFNLSEDAHPELTLVLKIFFTGMAALIAISTGFIKVYQIQEKLEKAIKLQQEWTSFGSMLSSELQLPVDLRKDALYLIVKFKDTYTELFKQQIDVSQKIIRRVAIKNGLEPYSLSLSELFERVLEAEADRLGITNNELENGTSDSQNNTAKENNHFQQINPVIHNNIAPFKVGSLPEKSPSRGKNELNKVADMLKGFLLLRRNKEIETPKVIAKRQKNSQIVMSSKSNTYDITDSNIGEIEGLNENNNNTSVKRKLTKVGSSSGNLLRSSQNNNITSPSRRANLERVSEQGIVRQRRESYITNKIKYNNKDKFQPKHNGVDKNTDAVIDSSSEVEADNKPHLNIIVPPPDNPYVAI